MSYKCKRCSREIDAGTWDVDSAKKHEDMLNVLEKEPICETCEFSFWKMVNKWLNKEVKRK